MGVFDRLTEYIVGRQKTGIPWIPAELQQIKSETDKAPMDAMTPNQRASIESFIEHQKLFIEHQTKKMQADVEAQLFRDSLGDMSPTEYMARQQAAQRQAEVFNAAMQQKAGGLLDPAQLAAIHPNGVHAQTAAEAFAGTDVSQSNLLAQLQQASPPWNALAGLLGSHLGGGLGQSQPAASGWAQQPHVPQTAPVPPVDHNAEKAKARWEGLQDGIEMAKRVETKQAAWDAFAAAALARGSTPDEAASIADELLKLRAERQGDA